MKRESIENIKKILQKYDEGISSVEEENILIQYFKSSNVAEELDHYKSEFNYYDTYRSFSLPNSFNFPEQNTPKTLLQKIISYLNKWYVLSATIIVTFCVVYFLQPEDKKNNELLSSEKKIKESQSDNIAFIEKMSKKKDTVLTENSGLDSKKKPIIKTKKSSNNLKENTDRAIQTTKKKDLDSNVQKVAVIQSINKFEPRNFEIKQSVNFMDSIDTVTAAQPPENEVLEKFHEMNFTITETTSLSTLTRMIHFARNAGISTTYEVDRHRKKIHEINIEMIVLKTGELSQIWIAVPKKSSFSVSLNWKEDKNGQAVSLFKSYVRHDVKPKHPLH